MPSQEPASAIVRWESVPRGSFARTWKPLSHLFSRPDWLPLGLRGWWHSILDFFLFHFSCLVFFPLLSRLHFRGNVFRKAFRVLKLMKGKGDGRWNTIFAFTLYSYCLFSALLDWIVEASMTERLTPRTLDLEVRGSSLTRRVFVSLDKELYSSLSLFT